MSIKNIYMNKKIILAFEIIVFVSILVFVISCRFALFESVIAILIPLVCILSAIFFVFGLFQVIVSSKKKEKRKVGFKIMISSVVSFLIIISIWGLIAFFEPSGLNGSSDTFDILPITNS